MEHAKNNQVNSHHCASAAALSRDIADILERGSVVSLNYSRSNVVAVGEASRRIMSVVIDCHEVPLRKRQESEELAAVRHKMADAEFQEGDGLYLTHDEITTLLDALN